jgi:hypothetical protein
MPRVYDKEGRELTVGARVEDGLNADFTGRVAGFYATGKSGERVEVRWLTPANHAGKQSVYPISADRTCDLVLCEHQQEGEDKTSSSKTSCRSSSKSSSPSSDAGSDSRASQCSPGSPLQPESSPDRSTSPVSSTCSSSSGETDEGGSDA